MGKKWMTVAVTAAAAVTIAGCGGSSSDDDADTLTAAELRQQAQQICATATTAANRIEMPSKQTPESGIRWAHERAAIQIAAARRLAALSAPEDQAASLAELATVLEERSRTLEVAQIKLEKADQTITNEFATAEDQTEKASRLSQGLQIPACNW